MLVLAASKNQKKKIKKIKKDDVSINNIITYLLRILASLAKLYINSSITSLNSK